MSVVHVYIFITVSENEAKFQAPLLIYWLINRP